MEPYISPFVARSAYSSLSSLRHCLRGTLIGWPLLVSIAWLGLIYSYLVPVRESLNPESPVETPPEQPYTNPELFRQQVIPLVITINSSADATCARIRSVSITKNIFILASPFGVILVLTEPDYTKGSRDVNMNINLNEIIAI